MRLFLILQLLYRKASRWPHSSWWIEHVMMRKNLSWRISRNVCNPVAVVLALCFFEISHGQEFYSKRLLGPNQGPLISETAVSSALHQDSFFVAVEAKFPDGVTTLRLYKIDSNENIVWVTNSGFNGTVHSLSVVGNPETGSVSAFVGK